MRGLRYIDAISRRIRLSADHVVRRLRVNPPPCSGGKVYVGCGYDQREGYIHCDVRRLPHVQYVCDAWEIDRFFRDSEAVYTRHMLEHLQFNQVSSFLEACFRSLCLGGELEIVVPDMDFHVGQWNRAVWNETAWADVKSNARHGAAGFWGWQGEKSGDMPFWDTHKSGFNASAMRFFLARAGFSHIVCSAKNGHLSAVAKKMLLPGERQVAPEIALIRADHRGRYHWAAHHISHRRVIYDLACGVGYGTQILSENTRGRVIGVDLDSEAIAYAKEFFAKPGIEFLTGDVLEVEIEPRVEAVVSFETIEHLQDPEPFLQRVASVLPGDGRFICSTPNQDRMPFNLERFPFHVRHYRTPELVDLLEKAGFHVLALASQHSMDDEEVRADVEGLFLLAVCQPRPF